MMKKMWKMRKDKSAVSPVIATILMVAITVVLAAVLYVMVMGFGGSGGSTPTGGIAVTKVASNANGTSQYTVQVLSISSNNVQRTDVVITCVPTVAGANNPGTLTAAVAGNTNVQAGDYATFYLTAGSSYSISLLYKPTNNNIASTTLTAA
jgi:flagellin-like protein